MDVALGKALISSFTHFIHNLFNMSVFFFVSEKNMSVSAASVDTEVMRAPDMPITKYVHPSAQYLQ